MRKMGLSFIWNICKTRRENAQMIHIPHCSTRLLSCIHSIVDTCNCSGVLGPCSHEKCMSRPFKTGINPWRRNVTTSMVGVKKQSQMQKSHPNGEPWGTQKKNWHHTVGSSFFSLLFLESLISQKLAMGISRMILTNIRQCCLLLHWHSSTGDLEVRRSTVWTAANWGSNPAFETAVQVT